MKEEQKCLTLLSGKNKETRDIDSHHAFGILTAISISISVFNFDLDFSFFNRSQLQLRFFVKLTLNPVSQTSGVHLIDT